VGLALTSRDSGRRDQVDVGRGAWARGESVSFAILDRLIDLEVEERPIAIVPGGVVGAVDTPLPRP
jgi:hypothetical protein